MILIVINFEGSLVEFGGGGVALSTINVEFFPSLFFNFMLEVLIIGMIW